MKWERLFEMERSYTTLSFSDRFEYIYDSFEGFESKMNFQIRALEYAIEEAMFTAQREGYMDRYSWDHRKESKERVREYLKNGCAVDFELETGLAPNERILTQYNNLQLMRLDYSILYFVLNSLKEEDRDLLSRYMSKYITLHDIAEERHITYDSAKALIRDLKKELKEQTICHFTEYKQSA